MKLVAALLLVLTRPALAEAPGSLRVTLLGTGNPRPSLERFGPSTLVEAPGEKPQRRSPARGAIR